MNKKFKDSDIRKLHKRGLTNRKMAKELGCHHNTIGRRLEELGLKTNGTIRGVLIIEEDKGKCTKCGEWKPLYQFAFIRHGKPDEYRLTFCNQCHAKQYNAWCNSHIDSFWSMRFHCWKKNAKIKNRIWDLSLDRLKGMFDKQKGKCFYTGEKMHMQVGKGLQDNSMSLDRVRSDNGYIEGNVVLCTRRFNCIKNNMTLEEIKKWMPPIYRKLKKAGFTDEQ